MSLDHLRGVFRQFESHAAALREIHGNVKRAVRFDDVNQSLIMDIKLDDTAWHRITAEEMANVTRQKKSGLQKGFLSTTESALARREKQLILLAHSPKT